MRSGGMAREEDAGYMIAEGGVHCPLCGARMIRGSYFCGRCRKNGRFHLNANRTRNATKEVYLPRGITRPDYHRFVFR